MSKGPPSARDDFVSEWDRCIHLLEQLKYWFWEADDELKTQRYAPQLAAVLHDVDPHGTTVRGAEGWALVRATERRWRECLEAKRHEIDMIRHLLADNVNPEVMDAQDLVIATEEYVLLARAAGDVEAADTVVSDVLGDGFFDTEQQTFVRELYFKPERLP